MKKLLLLAITMATISLVAMEQNQSEPFPYEQLLPELKGLVIQAVADAENVPEAITNFKNLLLTSKQFNTQQVNDLFLNALLKKFPGQEVRIARLLKNNFAKEWLKNVRPQANYNLIATSSNEADNALTYIDKKDLKLLENWLDAGYDPNAIARGGILPLIQKAIFIGYLPTLELLKRYGANFNGHLAVIDKSSYLQYAIRLKDKNKDNPEKLHQFNAVIDYLVQQGATLKPGEEEIKSN